MAAELAARHERLAPWSFPAAMTPFGGKRKAAGVADKRKDGGKRS